MDIEVSRLYENSDEWSNSDSISGGSLNIYDAGDKSEGDNDNAGCTYQMLV